VDVATLKTKMGAGRVLFSLEVVAGPLRLSLRLTKGDSIESDDAHAVLEKVVDAQKGIGAEMRERLYKTRPSNTKDWIVKPI
jgi:hypothetical protein